MLLTRNRQAVNVLDPVVRLYEQNADRLPNEHKPDKYDFDGEHAQERAGDLDGLGVDTGTQAHNARRYLPVQADEVRIQNVLRTRKLNLQATSEIIKRYFAHVGRYDGKLFRHEVLLPGVDGDVEDGGQQHGERDGDDGHDAQVFLDVHDHAGGEDEVVDESGQQPVAVADVPEVDERRKRENFVVGARAILGVVLQRVHVQAVQPRDLREFAVHPRHVRLQRHQDVVDREVRDVQAVYGVEERHREHAEADPCEITSICHFCLNALKTNVTFEERRDLPELDVRVARVHADERVEEIQRHRTQIREHYYQYVQQH